MVQRLPDLVDLSRFGIHTHNPEHLCCVCGASVRGQTECLFADELCMLCSSIRVKKHGRHVRTWRREAIFYRPARDNKPASVYVLRPQVHQSKMRSVVDGAVQPQRPVTRLSCVVMIDGVRYIGRPQYSGVSLFNTDGSLVRECGLQLSQQHLAWIYTVQR